jgi:nucleotide-binding universal stress UspA family protein
MIDTVVVATDGSPSPERAVGGALDLARRFDATVRALYDVDAGAVAASPADRREQVRARLTDRGEAALAAVAERAHGEVTTAIREGSPAEVVCAAAREHDASVVALGTRGRHGAHRSVLGSVAEAVVETCPVPVLTVRQLDSTEA